MRTHWSFAGPRRIAVGSTPGAAGRGAARGISAVALALTLAGCQSLGDGVADPPDDPTPGESPDDAVVLLQIEVSGGFVMMGYDFSRVPELTVYADGRAIVQGPQIAIYPGPVLPNLQVEPLSEADVAALIAAARDAGLLAEAPNYGQPWITDVPTTFVRLTVDGRTYEHAAYALGFFEGETSAGGGRPPAPARDRRTASARGRAPAPPRPTSRGSPRRSGPRASRWPSSSPPRTTWSGPRVTARRIRSTRSGSSPSR